MGYPEGNAHTLERFRLGKVTGGSLPADIFRRFMSTATKGQKLEAFPTVTRFPGEVLGGKGRSPFRPPAPTSSTAPGATTTTRRPRQRRPDDHRRAQRADVPPPTTTPPAPTTTAGATPG